MGKFLTMFFEMLVFAIIILIIYTPLKKHVFTKVKVNKWLILAITTVLFFGLSFLSPVMNKVAGYTIWTYVTCAVTIIMLLWFMDIAFPVKQKVVTKPKAKPNRVRHPNPKKK